MMKNGMTLLPQNFKIISPRLRGKVLGWKLVSNLKMQLKCKLY